jgi:trk system potassium uptake protein TrkH
MNFRFVLYVLGALLFIEGGLLLLPVVVSLLYGEHDLLPMLYSSGIAFAIGGAVWYANRNCSKEISRREGFVIVSTVWIVYASFGALPFVFSGYTPTFADAFFEAMSGFTTTGSTILKDIEALPHGLLFWRAFMHFTGGIGILVLGIAVLPIFGMGSMMIYQAEASTAAFGGKLSPRIKDSAKHIFRIYLILTVACIVLYLPGMNFFDAVCHAFSTIATGGFSTRNASLGAYSIYTQYITIFFMLLGSTSFMLFFYAWKREFRKITRNDELRFYLLLILAASIFIGAGLLLNGYSIEQALHESVFNVVSIISSTGYAINDYLLWSPPLWFIIFLISFIGGCAGSTSGGLKVVRFMLLFRMIPVQIKKIVHQNAIIQVKLNRQNVTEDRMFRTLAFFMIFLAVYTAGVFILMICGLDFTSAAGASIACLGNTGPGLELVGPASNFAELSAVGKYVCSFLMLFGRLELYSILILFSAAFWSRQ